MGGWVLGGCACGSAHAGHVSSARRGACVWWARVRASTCSRQPAAAAAASPEWVRCGRPPAWVLTRARLKPVRPVVVTEIGIARRARVHARREIARARRASRTAHARAHVHATHTHTPTRVHARRETRTQIRSDQNHAKATVKYLQLELPMELGTASHGHRTPPARIGATPRTAFFHNSF